MSGATTTPSTRTSSRSTSATSDARSTCRSVERRSRRSAGTAIVSQTMVAEAPHRGIRARFATVRVRVTVAATVVVAIGLIIGAVALLAVLRAGLLRSLSGSGPERAAEVAALASRGPLPDPLPDLEAPRLTLLQIIDTDGHVVAASRQLQGVPAVLAPTARRHKVIDEIAALPDGPWLV